jgi:drug/metabolite transporter (DMT)-like permease
MGPTEWALLVTLAVLWGGSFFLGTVALADLPPLTVVLGRVGLAALVLDLTVVLSGRRLPRDARTWTALGTMALLNNLLPFSLILWGQTQIASGLASMLNATTPLFTVVFAHWLTRDERLTPGRLAGVLAGLAGVAVMIGPAALAGLGRDVAAQVACLAGACSYGLAGIFGRRFRGMAPTVVAAGQVTATSVMVLPIVLLVDQPFRGPAPSGVTWMALAGLAVPCTALAYTIYFRVLAAAGATNLLLVTFLVPVTAILLGTTILGERLAPRHLAGMALIGLGLAAIDGRPAAALARAALPGRPRPE